jgi:hypothetical protein
LLAQLGFDVDVIPFEFFTFPARWVPSITATLFAAISLVAGYLTVERNSPAAAASVAIIAAVIVAKAASWLGSAGVTSLQIGRSASSNLVAKRPAYRHREPRIWIVAHMDSKSQTIPMLVRVISITVFTLLFLGMIGMLCAILVMHSGFGMTLREPVIQQLSSSVHMLSILSAVSAVPVILCFIRNESKGALDNATGVATVILAAELIGNREDVAVLITSAEELLMAGARDFAKSVSPSIAINCDTIDDEGRFLFMASGRLTGPLAEAVDRAAKKSSVVRRTRASSSSVGGHLRPMIPGIVADNVAFTSAGWNSFTLSRGNLGTLSRVHTSSDRADLIEGTGIVHAARVVAAIVEELT